MRCGHRATAPIPRLSAATSRSTARRRPSLASCPSGFVFRSIQISGCRSRTCRRLPTDLATSERFQSQAACCQPPPSRTHAANWRRSAHGWRRHTLRQIATCGYGPGDQRRFQRPDHRHSVAGVHHSRRDCAARVVCERRQSVSDAIDGADSGTSDSNVDRRNPGAHCPTTARRVHASVGARRWVGPTAVCAGHSAIGEQRAGRVTAALLDRLRTRLSRIGRDRRHCGRCRVRLRTDSGAPGVGRQVAARASDWHATGHTQRAELAG